MKITFDTNVFVSAFTRPEGRASQAIARIANRVDLLAISQPIVDELLRVLADKFGWNDAGLEAVKAWLDEYGHLVTPTETLAILADEPDNRILECALAADAQVIVTGDRAMLALGRVGSAQILSLASYLNVDNPLTNS